ncbi:TetR/AcrR family transcriptional regulator [Xanthomonas campestris]|uniref:TetR/AcrR family transcriptional regulator n=1 Tax=Xanthomonas cannabis TaxID=1885674 RepID=UPI001E501847|nr:TetR/AcrR family transcriptional regulator [Xanthomonas campestris pv. zinniae]
MGRKKTIDRDKVLDAAEAIIASRGGSGLTMDAVAQAAGITKGGVQSCFGTKEALIEAMLMRWGAMYQHDFDRHMIDALGPEQALNAHIAATADADDASNAKAAALIAGLLQSPDHLKWVQGWYVDRFQLIARQEGPAGVAARTAFFATEGLFFLKYFGLMQIGPEDWKKYFAELGEVLNQR